jgi:hypothetical protein
MKRSPQSVGGARPGKHMSIAEAFPGATVPVQRKDMLHECPNDQTRLQSKRSLKEREDRENAPP